MAFCSFSREFNENACTEVENRFITKYLPVADGFAVKVYLYGLYLCRCKDSDFSLRSMAEVLKAEEKAIADAFRFWEDYDLVEILSDDPFAVNYLPVRNDGSRPKKIRYEHYGDFNKELQRKMQSVGKFVSYNDSIKYMRFLEENDIQPQAFLLIAEYCINKQGEAVSPSYIFNKAKKFLANGWNTYEQVERELSSYNANEKDVTAVFNALSIYRKPDETDYALYRKWTEEQGFKRDGILEAAKKLKRGSMETLSLLLFELFEKGKTSAADIRAYLAERDMLSALTFKIARKLGVKVSNPAPYIDEYTEKWYTYGFEEDALFALALFCMKTDRGDFGSMDELIKKLFKSGVVASEAIGEYLKVKNDELKLFIKLQTYLGPLKKSEANLSLIETWREWSFSDEMILEAAKRSAGSAAPIPYMNKILSDWKHAGTFTLSAIPEKATSPAHRSAAANNAAVEDFNAKAAREKYYARLRDVAQSSAEKYLKKAQTSARFKEISTKLSRMEYELARAEISAPEKLPALQAEKRALLKERSDILKGMNLTETMLSPQYKCKKCSDTGFLSDGTACDCYPQGGESGGAVS